MLTDFKFLTAAVARKDFVEELCHFHIHGGRAWAFDGMMSMSTKVDVGLTVRPHASSFIKAIEACGEKSEIAMHLTDAGRLSVNAGKFRAFVNCLDVNQDAVIPKPEGEEVELTDELLASLTELAPFMSIDASRPWAQGLRIFGGSTYATNNIILVQRWHGSEFPYEVIVPSDFVKAVIKINQKPISAQVTHSSLTFHYPDERWIRTQLVVGKWPENLENIFKDTPVAKPLPEEFFPALDQLKPFMDDSGRVYIYPDRVATAQTDGEGAAVAIETEIDGALFHLEQLRLLQTVMKRIDLAAYPAPCPWYGQKMRGMIVGQRY